MLVVPVPESDSGAPLQGVSGVEGPAKDPVGRGTERDREGKDRWKIRDLLADERCGRAVLDFLYSMDMGRRGPVEEDDAVSAVSELEEQGVAGGAGSGGRGAGCWGDSTVPPHATLHGVCRTGLKGGGVDSGPSFVFSFVFHARSPFNFLVAPHIFLGQAWTEGKGELATCRHCADSGLDTDCIYPRHDLIGRMRVINKQKKKILTLLSSNRGINPRMITTSDLMLKSLHAEERGIAFWGRGLGSKDSPPAASRGTIRRKANDAPVANGLGPQNSAGNRAPTPGYPRRSATYQGIMRGRFTLKARETRFTANSPAPI